MVIGDVGQDAEEEIDFAHPGQNVGANYGWPCYEGPEIDTAAPASECTPLPSPVVFPVLAYPHPQNCGTAPFCGDGIIGGYVMHDPALPSLDGCYLYGDLGNPGLRIVHLAEPFPSASVALGPGITSLSSFGLDASGHVYAADIANGDVYRLESDGNPATAPRCMPPPPLVGAPPQGAPVSTSGAQVTVNRPPRLSRLRITPASFRTVTSGPAGSRGGRHGTSVTFHLNEKATVTFTVQRAEAGRELNGRCQPHSDTHHN